MSSRLGRFAGRLALVAFGIAFACAASALAIQLFWCGRANATYEYQSGPFLAMNPYWSSWHYAANEVEHRRSCFDVRYGTNDFGMRGGPVKPGGRRIALLGDSFVEGFGVNDDETAAARMQQQLGTDFQVLNFGVSGFFTTINEVSLYENLARFFDPEITILFFLNYNDLEDSMNASQRKLVDADLNLVYPRAKSLAEVEAVIRSMRPKGGSTLRGSCAARFWRVFRTTLKERVEMALDLRWDFHEELARPYRVAEDAATQHAWAIVERSLAHLAELTQAHGSKLLVVDLADPYQIDPGWLRVTRLSSSSEISPTKPNQRLGAICRKLGISFYDMYPEVTAYVAEHRLEFPYLSLSCDRHYAANGQQILADLIVAHLRRSGTLVEPAASSPSR